MRDVEEIQDVVEVLRVVLTGLAAVVAGTLSIGWWCRPSGGKLEREQNAARIRLVTRRVKVTFHRGRREIRVVTPKGEHRFEPEADGVRFTSERTTKETWEADWGPTDLMGQYRDLKHSWTLLLVSHTQRIPLVEVRQREVRDFLDFATPLALAVLRQLGLHRDANEVIQDVRREFEDALEWLQAAPAG